MKLATRQYLLCQGSRSGGGTDPKPRAPSSSIPEMPLRRRAVGEGRALAVQLSGRRGGVRIGRDGRSGEAVGRKRIVAGVGRRCAMAE